MKFRANTAACKCKLLAVGTVSRVLGGGPLASRARCAEDTGGTFQGESGPVLVPEHQVSAGL